MLTGTTVTVAVKFSSSLLVVSGASRMETCPTPDSISTRAFGTASY
jgi:hypothetical protein